MNILEYAAEINRHMCLIVKVNSDKGKSYFIDKHDTNDKDLNSNDDGNIFIYRDLLTNELHTINSEEDIDEIQTFSEAAPVKIKLRDTEWFTHSRDAIECNNDQIYDITEEMKKALGKYINNPRAIDIFRSDPKSIRTKSYLNLSTKLNLQEPILCYSDINNSDLDEIKAALKVCILESYNNAVDLLAAEAREVNDDDTESLEEIELIRDMLTNIIENIDNEFEKLSTPVDTLSFWPPLLLPHPLGPALDLIVTDPDE